MKRRLDFGSFNRSSSPPSSTRSFLVSTVSSSNSSAQALDASAGSTASAKTALAGLVAYEDDSDTDEATEKSISEPSNELDPELAEFLAEINAMESSSSTQPSQQIETNGSPAIETTPQLQNDNKTRKPFQNEDQHPGGPLEPGELKIDELKSDAERLNLEIDSTAKLIMNKLQSLTNGVTMASMDSSAWLMMTTLIEIRTRHVDWTVGALLPAYFIAFVKAIETQLKSYEESAAPPNWSCLWDKDSQRYYYVHKDTGTSSWEYPTGDPIPPPPLPPPPPATETEQQFLSTFEPKADRKRKSVTPPPPPPPPPDLKKKAATPMGKKQLQLLAKWKAKDQELKEAAEEEEGTASAYERKHQKRIEQWKQQQLQSGAAEDNPNFVPISDDWRKKFQEAKSL